MSTLVSVIGIPLYRLVIVKVIPRVKNVRMLTKMWMGLYLSLLQVVLYIIVVVNHDTTYWQQHHTVIPYQLHYPPGRLCYIIRTGYEFSSNRLHSTMTQSTTPTCGSLFPSSSMVSLLCLSQ